MNNIILPNQNITTTQIIFYLLARWRLLITFSICGCFCGLLYNIFIIPWVGSTRVLLAYENSMMDVVEFKKFQKNVPVVISQSRPEKDQDKEYLNLNKNFYSPDFWTANVKADTVLSKIDVREMTASNSGIDSASSYISSITFFSKMSDKHEAKKNAYDAFQIFIKAGTSFKLKSLVETLSIKVSADQLSTKSNVNNSKNLIKKFEDYMFKNYNNVNELLEPKSVINPVKSTLDVEVINLVNNEIQLRKLNILKNIVPQLERDINNYGYDGIQLGKRLLSIIQNYKSSVNFKGDDPEMSALEELEKEILLVTFSSDSILKAPSITAASKSSFLISAAIGGSLGFFFMLLLLTIKLIAQNQYAITKSRGLS